MDRVDPLTTHALVDAAYALGIGLVVGLEREHRGVSDEGSAGETASQAQKSERTVAMGVRTFALFSLVGWAAGFLGATWSWIPPIALLVIGGLVAVEYVLVREFGTGLTTELAAVMTLMLGLLVNVDRGLAAALALATTIILYSKPWVRSVVVRVRRVELSGTFQLLILLAIVLPLLPSEPHDPWDALPPRRIGFFVVLIAGISYVGYILTRALGQRRSAGLTGIFGGITSSTAVTIAMARTGRLDSMRQPAQLAVFLANAIMFGRVLVITAVLSRAVATALLIPLGAMGVVMLGGALWRWRTLGPATPPAEMPKEANLQNPFALIPALKWGAILCAVLLLAHFAQEFAGTQGLYAAAAASGIADVDAITLAVTRQASELTLPYQAATTAITIAVMTNTVIKAVLAVFGGGRAFGAPIAVVFLASVAAGAAMIVAM
jgi:uncharacterized membrane protein (DUF4010 family)